METASVAKDTTWKQSSNNGKPLVSAMRFSLKNTTNGTSFVVLTTAQRRDVACMICKEAKVEKEKVIGTDGVHCDDTGVVSAATNGTNSTKRIL